LSTSTTIVCWSCTSATTQGNAFVYEYDPQKKPLRTLVDISKLLDLPDGHYVPGKIHSRIDMGSDGWLYFGTHRGVSWSGRFPVGWIPGPFASKASRGITEHWEAPA
jgi:hypothetical protein